MNLHGAPARRLSAGLLVAACVAVAAVAAPGSSARSAMVEGSLATSTRVDAGAQMLTLHAPEGLGLEALDRARA